jgi:hypothetical protein
MGDTRLQVDSELSKVMRQSREDAGRFRVEGRLGVEMKLLCCEHGQVRMAPT